MSEIPTAVPRLRSTVRVGVWSNVGLRLEGIERRNGKRNGRRYGTRNGRRYVTRNGRRNGTRNGRRNGTRKR